MKKQISIFLIFFLFIVNNTFSQSFSPDLSKVDEYIIEVYADKVQALGYNTSLNRERFLNILQRVIIVEKNSTHPENMTKFSEIPLISTYNPDLKRDDSFNPEAFNPLKYKFDVFSKDRTVYYLVDNTNYIIIIHPDQKF